MRDDLSRYSHGRARGTSLLALRAKQHGSQVAPGPMLYAGAASEHGCFAKRCLDGQRGRTSGLPQRPLCGNPLTLESSPDPSVELSP